MSKNQKIDTILALAAKKNHHVIQPRPELTFVKHGDNENLFKCEETGEIMNGDDITVRYMCSHRRVEGLPRITGFNEISIDANGNLITIKIVLLAIDKPEIVFDG